MADDAEKVNLGFVDDEGDMQLKHRSTGRAIHVA